MENDPHAHFRELCLIYGDFHRDVFLEEFEQWFIRGASKQELSRVRNAVQRRAKVLRRAGGKRGRPLGRDDEEFLYKARVVVWHRIVDGWDWPRIAKAVGLEPTKPNIRTVQRRRDELAAIVYQTLPLPRHADDPENLKRDLESKTIQNLFWLRTGLPFRTRPEQCKKVVLELAPRGIGVAIDKIHKAAAHSK